MIFQGMGVALVTPFNEDGSVDFISLRRLIEYQLSQQIDFFVLHGSTGESACIMSDERAEIIRFVVELVNHRKPIVVGLGSNCTQSLVQRAQELESMNIDAILSVVPYYNKPSQEGIFLHFKALAESTSLPIILYNIPGRTGVNMTPDTTVRLANNCKNIVAVKEASGIVMQVKQIVEGGSPKDFTVLSGDDNLSIQFMEVGAKGVISVIGNAFPSAFHRLIHAQAQGDYELAAKIQEIFKEMYKLLFVCGNPAGIKCLLYHQGLIAHNKVRLPLTPVNHDTEQLIIEEYHKVRQALESIL
ncbi:4-hydroxy-tetrahydrodipicolinate synthase [Porphyromonas pogonae]|uniref:4-hydroxy-tetrahydrodipicolinate synthase n=1 Tax=Porphyromonas pogonae TaxID=867595 RepID=UPI002E7947EF|nr:4-hydroxy-tetrahydrodipicolinate synthase [Porphyromonas pogonae]